MVAHLHHMLRDHRAGWANSLTLFSRMVMSPLSSSELMAYIVSGRKAVYLFGGEVGPYSKIYTRLQLARSFHCFHFHVHMPMKISTLMATVRAASWGPEDTEDRQRWSITTSFGTTSCDGYRHVTVTQK